MSPKAGPTQRDGILESVWDYPLPPVVESSASHAQVILNGFVIADSSDLYRVLQTGLPPSYYFAPDDVQLVYLRPNGEHTDCVYRGRATYFDVVVGDRDVKNGAWSYRDPLPGYTELAERIAFYPGRMDACLLDGVPVRADLQEDRGGWITPNILGLSLGYPRSWEDAEDT